ncbi:probable (S)-ureidoglycine aminohydrolase isoform X2 [Phalaenopsis equestris]|uniref:probable (S)-ureidoglycine aminohydrolase isoform X2 n=1 Tax=Phalaenopsis equestris TaxID=78828 RepID=UPI0009E4B56E|nr:probable (S)-ureidoglycine aminohydrolase isoform X2 [Phalaenopsis equestris]
MSSIHHRPNQPYPSGQAEQRFTICRRISKMLGGPHALLLLLLVHPAVTFDVSAADEFFCSVPSLHSKPDSKPNYSKVTNPTLSPSHFQDLPGFTRSVYKTDHALITPESQVFSPLPNWLNSLGAYLISPATGSHFTMNLVKMQEDSRSALPAKDVERFVFVLQGSSLLLDAFGISHQLNADFFAYIPANTWHQLKSDSMAVLVIFERRYVSQDGFVPEQIIGSTDKQPLLETPGEVFELRKLLPTSTPYDFNIHAGISVRTTSNGCICSFTHGISVVILWIFNPENILMPRRCTTINMACYYWRDREYIALAITGTLFKQAMPFGWHHLYHNGMQH